MYCNSAATTWKNCTKHNVKWRKPDSIQRGFWGLGTFSLDLCVVDTGVVSLRSLIPSEHRTCALFCTCVLLQQKLKIFSLEKLDTVDKKQQQQR